MKNIIGLAGQKLSTPTFGGLYPMSLKDHLSLECGAREYEQNDRATMYTLKNSVAKKSALCVAEKLQHFPSL